MICKGFELQDGIVEALLVNTALVAAAVKLKALTIRGALIMGLMGFWIYIALGWRGYIIPIIFFVMGSLFTRLGYEEKRKRLLAQKGEGTRGIREVLANGAVPLILTVPIILVDSRLFTIGYVAAWATALCDTSSTELGGLWGKRSYLIKNLQRVPAGTEGAVSIEGTAAGFLTALILAAAACGLKLVSLKMVLPLGIAALFGSLFESYLAEIIPPTRRIKHEILNIANTSIGSGLALFWGVLLADPK